MYTKLFINKKRFIALVLSGACLFGASAVVARQAEPVVDIKTWQTSNGASVYFVEIHQLPIVDARVVFDAGSAYDGKHPGIAQLTSAMLDEGTMHLNADQIAESFDSVGSRFTTNIGRDFSFVGFRSLSDDKYLKPTLNVFQEIVSQARFPMKEFQRVKGQTLTSLKYQEQLPSKIAEKAFYSSIYGAKPYGHPVDGTTKTVESIEREDLVNFYNRYYVAQNATIVLVGDLSQDNAKEIAEGLSSQMTTGDKAARDDSSKVDAHEITKNIIFPSSQTTVLIGQIGIKKNSPDYFAAYVGNYVLGGGLLTSRLMKSIREKHGYAYSVTSAFNAMLDKGPFLIQLQTRNSEATNAMDMALKILSDYVSLGPSKAELALAKGDIIQSFPLKLSSNSAIFNNVSNIAAYRLPLNYLDTYCDNVRKITVNDIKQAFKRLIDANQLVKVTVGDIANSNGTPVAGGRANG